MGKTERKDGYYWVKYIGDRQWTIAKKIRDSIAWIIIGIDGVFPEQAFLEIGPRIPEYKPKRKGKA